MKKILSQIIVFSLLLTGYCPFAFGSTHKGMGVDVAHASHDADLSKTSHSQMDCCDEGMPDVIKGYIQSPNELEGTHVEVEFLNDFSVEVELDPPHWKYFAHNSDPPHLHLTGTLVSLE